MLEALGLHVWFRYQKFREEFAAEDATIALDETPVGTFVELEGGERAILTMTYALGRTPADFILDSYRSLFLARRDRVRARWRQHGVRGRMIPALVLTAGLATRLRPLSLVRAKAALPVAGEPLVHRILRSARASGVTDVVLNLHHLPHTLTSLVGDGTGLGVRVRYSWEVPVLGSAGGPRRAVPLLVLDLPHRQRRHADRRGRRRVDGRPSPVGRARHDGRCPTDGAREIQRTERRRQGAVTGFAPRGSAETTHHFIGVQVVEAEAFAAVPANVPSEYGAALSGAHRRAAGLGPRL